jgi:uncharacterized protein (DUF302 family)
MTSSGTISATDKGIVSIRSLHSFADTLQRLLQAFADHGIRVFAVIDQSTEAMAVGLQLPPTTLIVFGNPKSGTPLMLAQPLSGIDLPLKALITESMPGQVMVSFNAAAYIVERHSLAADLLNNLAPAERLIAGVVAK